MPLHPDVLKAQAATLDLWSREWRQEAGNGVEGAAEIGWQLQSIAKLVRKVAGIEPATVAAAGEPEQELPQAAAGALRPDTE